MNSKSKNQNQNQSQTKAKTKTKTKTKKCDERNNNELPATKLRYLEATQLVLAELKISVTSHVWGSLVYQKKRHLVITDRLRKQLSRLSAKVGMVW